MLWLSTTRGEIRLLPRWDYRCILHCCILDAIDDPKEAWDKLGEHYCKRTWANRFELRNKLHLLRLREGGSVQDHERQMAELFSGLADVLTHH